MKKIGHRVAAAKNFQRFHGKNVSKVVGVEFTMPRALTFLARAHAVEYVSNKTNGPKDRTPGGKIKTHLYRHAFGPDVKIYLHPNKRWILIGGGRFRVTDWMRD